MAGRPRLVDVAARAGVSEKTVSNFVNGYPHISASTREKVEAAISELGYRPNLSARSMGRGRTGFIAFAVPGLDNPYFAELAGRVISRAAEERWTVLIEETGGRKTSEDALVDTMPYLVDGIILHPESLTAVDIAERGRDTPIVLIGERDLARSADHVVSDNVAAAREITQHLLDSGRRSIATIGLRPDASLQTSQLRHWGFSAALERMGLVADEDLSVAAEGYARADGDLAMQQILASGKLPDAVLCFNAVVAAGALSRLAREGISVPGRVAVAAFDDIDEAAFMVPPLTTVAWDVGAIADSAVRLLAERQEARTAPVREVSVGYRLEIRASTTGL
ncbi:LacI family DNA-binding transcriptional regulator [Amnibacterium flavum]|uniref:LacI family transcriptional regulator n=1 Tax=Amnibacterium flavum TaxID=2173173 RepID=A0A2V1HVN3_9MICO|nr:LacI family DNA-binding transcriptional regulator [Amnibacterium flavum]PVZ94427.1 LacI family transcriptional regulator [Amnibacterium flavum]